MTTNGDAGVKNGGFFARLDFLMYLCKVTAYTL